MLETVYTLTGAFLGDGFGIAYFTQKVSPETFLKNKYHEKRI